MTNLKHLDMMSLDDIFEMRGGYVLDFSDRTIAIFFTEELGIDFDDPKIHCEWNVEGEEAALFASDRGCFYSNTSAPSLMGLSRGHAPAKTS